MDIDWAKYLPKDEFPDMPEGIGGLTEIFRHQVLSIGYERVKEKPKDDKPKQAPKKKP